MSPSQHPIYIIGAGAVGKALAVMLHASGRRPVLVRGSVDHEPPRRERIQIDLRAEETVTATLEVTTISHISPSEGLLAITTKAFGNRILAGKLEAKAKQLPLVLLQNGLGVEAPFVEKGFQEIYRGVLFMTSQTHADRNISYRPVAPSPIGVIRQAHTSLADIVSYLNVADFPFCKEPEIEKVIWEKAIINCVFNSICPLLNIDNGVFQREEDVLQMAREVIAECVVVARASGIDLTEQALENRVRFISQASDGQLISTLQDLRQGRPTEIDSFNLEVARLADGLGLSDKVSMVRTLGRLIAMKSSMRSTS